MIRSDMPDSGVLLEDLRQGDGQRLFGMTVAVELFALPQWMKHRQVMLPRRAKMK